MYRLSAIGLYLRFRQKTWHDYLFSLQGIEGLLPYYQYHIWQKFATRVPMEWFHRIWTLQELLFATDAMFMCGHATVSWRNLRLTHAEQLASFIGIGDPLWSVQKILQAKQLFATRPRWPGVRYDQLIMLLYDSANSKMATESHDRVYGLYAIFIALSAEMEDPDYGLPIADLHEAFTFTIIQATRSLSPITHTKAPIYVPGRPSWVPDFASKIEHHDEILAKVATRSLETFRPTFKLSRRPKSLTTEGQRFAKALQNSVCSLDFHRLPSTLQPQRKARWKNAPPIPFWDLSNTVVRVGTAIDMIMNSGMQLNRTHAIGMLVHLPDIVGLDSMGSKIYSESNIWTRMSRMMSPLHKSMHQASTSWQDDNCLERLILRNWEAGKLLPKDRRTQFAPDFWSRVEALYFGIFRSGWTHAILLTNGCAGWARQLCEAGDVVYSCYGAPHPMTCGRGTMSSH